MPKVKIFKKGINYVSKKKGIHGLSLQGTRNSGWATDYCVVECMTAYKDPFKRKVVYKGTITECRAYMKGRFYE